MSSPSDTLSCSIDPIVLTPKLQEAAFRELGETEASRNEALQDLRRRIEELPVEERIQDTSDRNLIRFIRARKYNPEKAFETLKAYDHFHKTNPEWVQIENPEEELLFFKSFLNVIEYEDEEGGKLVVIMLPEFGVKLLTPEYLAAHPLAMVRFNLWLFDQISNNVYAQIFGVMIINTFRNLTFWDQVTISRFAPISHHVATIRYLFDCVGLRLSAAIILEEPAFFHVIWGIAKVFLNEKMKSRFHFCGKDYHKIEEVIPNPASLPECLNGEVPKEKAESWLVNLVQKQYGVTLSDDNEK
jgi:hypothetical protein